MIDKTKYLSPSFFVAMGHYCQAKKIAQERGIVEVTKEKPLLIGGYIDAYFSNRLDEFKNKNPEIFKKDGSLYAEFKQAEEIISVIKSDELFMEYISGDNQVYVEGEIAGVWYRGFIDSLFSDKIVDLKILSSIYRGEWIRKDNRNVLINIIEHQGIDEQMAIYRELVYQLCGEYLPCYVAAATKEKHIDKEIIEIDKDILDIAFNRVEEKSKLYWDIRYGKTEPKRCGKCDYCLSTKKLTKPISLKDIQNGLRK